jgi:hypothetical protein
MTNKSGDDFDGFRVNIPKCFELNHDMEDPLRLSAHREPVILRVTKLLIYEDMLVRALAQTFFRHREHLMTEEIRREFMEKYGVQVDKNKTDKNKKGDGEKTAGANDPNVNVPKDPDKGTEPFEKNPEEG